MLKPFYQYTTPPDARIDFTLDGPPGTAGETFVNETPTSANGRTDAHIFQIDKPPDFLVGARRIITHKSKVTSDERGIFRLARDGSQWEFISDDVHLQEASPFPGSALPRLVVEGQHFRSADGARFTAIETSDFNLFARFVKGEDIRPVLEERAVLGFNLLRVWTLMDLEQYGIGRLLLEEHPELYDRLPEFLEGVASYGLRIELTAYTGINDPQHWARLCLAATAASTWPLVEAVNELDQNTNEPDHLGRVYDPAFIMTPPAGLLCSRGSNGSQAQPVQPFLQYVTFHTNGASEEQRKVGHNAMEIWNGPSLTNETSRYEGQYSDHFAYDSAAGAALLCAGSCFHSPSGKRSSLFTADERTRAQAWIAGARSVPLEFQDGAYRHRDDLEGPGILRVYSRRLADGREHLVEIRV